MTVRNVHYYVATHTSGDQFEGFWYAYNISLYDSYQTGGTYSGANGWSFYIYNSIPYDTETTNINEYAGKNFVRTYSDAQSGMSATPYYFQAANADGNISPDEQDDSSNPEMLESVDGFVLLGGSQYKAFGTTYGAIDASGGSSGATINGTGASEVLEGTSAGEIINGNGGNDTIYGYGGNDFLNGSTGNDALFGGDGDDQLNGFAGSDVLYGGSGANSFNGGDGLDYAIFAFEGAVTINLTGSSAHAGSAAGDTFNSIEGFYLSPQADAFIGTSSYEFVFAGAGDDSIVAGGGGDIVYGEDGNDQIISAPLGDIFYGGAGNDTFIYLTNVIQQDFIGDFTPGSDKFSLSSGGFNIVGGLTAGVNFISTTTGIGASYSTMTGVVLYYSDLGALYVDPDGAGPGAANLLAAVTPTTFLQPSDFVIS